MKRLKALRFLAVSAGLAMLPLQAANTHVPVAAEAWTFIGVSGFQNQTAASGSTNTELIKWKDTSASRVLVDASYAMSTTFAAGGLELPTWDGNVSSKCTQNPSSLGCYDASTTSTTDSSINVYEPRDPSTGTNQDILGKNYYATVGLMVLGQEASTSSTNTDTKSSTTDHGGATIAAINYYPKKKDFESAMRTMYIKSPNATAPDIKVIYQASYEGQKLYVTYATSTYSASVGGGYSILKPNEDNNDLYYEGVFGREYTYDNPATLGNTFGVKQKNATAGANSSAITGIMASFDMNLSDNNFTSGQNSVADASELKAGVDSSLAAISGSLRAPLEGNLTVLSWDTPSQSWKVYRGSGRYDTDNLRYVITEDAANDFSAFEAGKGYWVKLEKDLSYTYSADSTSTPSYGNVAGFVLGDGLSIDHSSFIGDGWNMMAFGDDYLSYSTTGMIVDFAGLVDFNLTDTYGATSLNIDLSAGSSTDVNCSIINSSIDSNRTKRYTALNVKCIPTSTGAVLLSNRSFSLMGSGATAPTGLLGEALIADSNGSHTWYQTTYGKNILVIEPNTGWIAGTVQSGTTIDANMSVEYPQSTAGAKYAGVSSTIATTVSNIKTAMDAADPTGATNNTIGLSMHYDASGTGHDAVLMVSTHKFFIKDATLVQAWQNYATHERDATAECTPTGAADTCLQDENTTIGIYGKQATTFTYVDDNITQTVANINGSISATTELNATKLRGADDNSTIAVWYTGWKASGSGARISYFQLQEQGTSQDVLMEVPVTGSINSIPLDNRSKTTGSNDVLANVKNPFYGGIGRVWQITDIVSAKQTITNGADGDGNYTTAFISYKSTADLKFQAMYSQNYPTSGPLYDIVTTYGKKPELIITGHTEAGSSQSGYTIGSGSAGTVGQYISWKQIDATIDPKEWYDADNQFELFWTEKEKGYWVYLNGASSSNLTLGTSLTLSKATYTDFNNYFGSSSTTTTRNHIDYTATVSTTGLFSAADSVANNDAYEVYATINGANVIALQRAESGTGFTFKISSHETPGVDFDYGTIDITITAAYASGDQVSQTYSVDYNKPVIESVTPNGAVFTTVVTNADAQEIHVYAGDINNSSYGDTTATLGGLTTATNWAGKVDVTSDTVAVNVGGYSAFSFPTAFGTDGGLGATMIATTSYDEQAEQSVQGLVAEVHLVAKDSENLYSDQYKAAYIAFYSGSGVLSSQSSGTGTTSATGWDIHPVVYTSGGSVDTNYAGGNTGIDDGVQLKSAIEGTDITCVYAHNDNVRLDQGAILTNNLKIGTSVVGVIGYRSEMDRKPFFCTTNGLLYVGQFKDRTTTQNDEDIELIKLLGVSTLTLSK